MSVQETSAHQSQEPQTDKPFRSNVEYVPLSEATPRYKQLVQDAGRLIHKSMQQEQENMLLNAEKVDLTHRVSELEAEAGTDALTGLANKKAFLFAVDKTIEREKARPGEYGDETNAFALRIDLDKFKEVNDTFGHDAGDNILQIVGTAIQAAVRSSDLPARTEGVHDEEAESMDEQTEENAQAARPHGDEFDVLVQDIELGIDDVNMTKEQRAAAIIANIREAVSLALSETIYGKLGIGISIGGTFYRHGESADDFLKRADLEMYKDKGYRRDNRPPSLSITHQTPVKILGADYREEDRTSGDDNSALIA